MAKKTNINDLYVKFENLTKEARSLNDEGKFEDAKAKIEEARSIKTQIDNYEAINALEEVEEREIKMPKDKKTQTVEERYIELGKAILGGEEVTAEFNTEERAIITGEPASSSVTAANMNSNSKSIIPAEFINKVLAYREGYTALKSYCTIIPVSTDTGSMPAVDLEGELADLVEDTDMVETMIALGDIPFATSDYGLLRMVGDNLLKDSPVNFMNGILAPAFAIASINKENKKIMAQVNGTLTSGAFSVDTIETDISKVVPSQKTGLKIIANPEAYAVFDTLKATDGHHDERVTYANGKMYFKQVEVVEVADKNLPTKTTGKTKLAYLVNMAGVIFFDRQIIEIAQDKSIGFKKRKLAVRAIERFDQKVDPKAVAKKYEA